VTTAGRALRQAPRASALPLVERVAVGFLERALECLEGGTLEVTLPDGSIRRFGSGAVVAMTVHSDAIFRRLALRGKVGFGESYTAGDWDAPDLAALF